jgi:hypothetical protein
MAKRETRWVWEYDVADERANELSRQKGFKHARPITDEVKKKERPVNQAHEGMIQYDQPNEPR